MSKVYDWIVVGKGVSSQLFLYWLNKKTPTKLSVLQLYSPSFKSASEQGTGLLLPFGVSSGLSELGDDLITGLAQINEILDELGPSTFTVLKAKHFANVDNENFKRRYTSFKTAGAKIYAQEWGRFLHWQEFNTQLENRLPNLEITRVQEHVEHWQDDQAILVQAHYQNFTAKKLFLGLGAHHAVQNAEGKTVAGDSCYWQAKVFPEDMLLSFNGHNAFQVGEQFCFGSTSIERQLQTAVSWPQLCQAYTEFKAAFEEFNFPDLNTAQIKSGFRHKMSKRRPVSGHEGNVYFIRGLYKNGYRLASVLAKRILEV